MSSIELPMAVPAPPVEPSPDAPAPAAQGQRFRVEGMDCAACARTVEKTVAALDGVTAAQVSFGAGTLAVQGTAPAAAITSAVSRAGYRARPAEHGAGTGEQAPFWRRDRRALSASASVVFLLAGAAASAAGAGGLAVALYLLSMAVGGWPIAVAAAGALRRRTLDMNVLMALAAVGGGHRRVRRGRLGARALRRRHLARVEVVALDKTGTLTLGLPRLETVVALDVGEDEAISLAAAVESSSEHPLAAAVRRAAVDRGLAVPAAGDFRALPGRGAEAEVDGRDLWVGGPRLVTERTGAAPAALAELERSGQTAVALGEGDRVLALLGLADQAREHSAQLAPALRAAGIEHVVMLTGDAEPVARAVGARAGLDDVRAGLLPEDKLDAVRALERRGPVAMVGDGINDAPALAAARVGVAMGAAGSDTALQTADVALMGDRLDRLPEAVVHARRALSIMRVNVVASLAVKAIFVVLAPFGLVTLVVAVAADMGMSLLVTFNALRLLRTGEEPARPAPAGREAAAQACCSDGSCTSEATRNGRDA